MVANKKPSFDFYQEITNQIIEALEAGVKPWVCPWDRSIANGLPSNVTNGNYYNGLNIMLLWMSAAKQGFTSSSWLTAKQASEQGGWIRKGEKGTRIFFYKMVQKRDSEDENDTYPMLKTFVVFNTQQVENVKFELPETEATTRTDVERLEHVESFINQTGANIAYRGHRAFFRPSTDEIVIPETNRFNNASDLYATVLHELTHWTGHESRLKREFKGEFGSKDYAFEELVAELGCSFLMAGLGIVGDVQHESYIASWLKALKDDKRYIFKAASLASKAHQFLLELVSKDIESQKVA